MTTVTGAEAVSWDLSDLYAGPDDPAIERDISSVREGAAAFRERYHGRVGELNPAELASAVRELEELSATFERLSTFATLRFSTDTADPQRGAFIQRMREEGARLSAETLFLSLEWNLVDDERAEELLSSPEIGDRRRYLSSQRRYRPYLLSEPEERVLTELAPSGINAWSRLFTELNGATRVEVDGEELTTEQAIANLQRPDRDLRRRTAEGITAALGRTLRTRTLLFNTVLLDKATKDRLRGYPHWLASRNLSNEASDKSVEALVDAVVSRFDIPHRYYALKASLLGLDRIADYDRMAPITADDVTVSWDEAREIVTEAYEAFSPVTGGIVRDFFERAWIDAAPMADKTPGAFCAVTVPGVHPYVLMTFTGERNSVLTLAHELGHGVHGELAGRRHGLFNARVGLTMAETASVFGEQLTFHRLLGAEPDPARRLALLTSQIEDAIATVFRQIAMNRFEDAIHNTRRDSGELPIDALNEVWESTQRHVLGDAVEITEGYRSWWSYIPHFVATPGYVYAYGFGYLFSLAIFRRYLDEGEPVVEPYLELLSSGGAAPPGELARIVGVDLEDPSFWTRGLESVDAMLAEAEELSATAAR